MIWWFIIPSAVLAALVFAYREHTRQARRLRALFVPLAARYGGVIKDASWFALPRLGFERASYAYEIGAMASAGPNVSGTASRPGFNGAFTFVNVALREDTGHEVRFIRNDRLDRAIERTVHAVPGVKTATTGDREFDAAYRMRAGDENFLRRIVDPRLRKKLLHASAPKLELVLSGSQVSVHVDDYVGSASALEEMIDLATLLADNCASAR